MLDARELATPELVVALDGFMAGVDGLDFGRFDVRVPDADALRAGVGMRVLELNGVTGEPAHVYQPGYPVRRGLRDLRDHWRAACATGAANVAAGRATPMSFWRLLALIPAVRRRVRFEAPASGPADERIGTAAGA
ncbi:MAG: hypothetical protein IPM29_21815 [Planctomycetes bacterium]|nr:hypothetical protein [Planctomycetota bacterium]